MITSGFCATAPKKAVVIMVRYEEAAVADLDTMSAHPGDQGDHCDR
jgi:hypothetical protein